MTVLCGREVVRAGVIGSSNKKNTQYFEKQFNTKKLSHQLEHVTALRLLSYRPLASHQMRTISSILGSGTFTPYLNIHLNIAPPAI